MSGFLGLFSGFSRFPILIPPTVSTSCYFIFSFIRFMPSFTSFMVRKNSCFGAPPVYKQPAALEDEAGCAPSATPLDLEP